jgi:hypothetical protein
MKYIMRVTGEPVLYNYGKNDRRHSYVIEKQERYREELLRHYERPSPLTKSAKLYYLSEGGSRLLHGRARETAGGNLFISYRTDFRALAKKKSGKDRDGWERFLYQLPRAYSNISKNVAAEKSQKMGFELMELKTDGSHYEFLIREKITHRIVQWGDLPDVDTVREYLEKHLFPKDQCYLEEEFLDDVAAAKGYIHLPVEKRQTAEFIRDLIYELVGQDSRFKHGSRRG